MRENDFVMVATQDDNDIIYKCELRCIHLLCIALLWVFLEDSMKWIPKNNDIN